MTPNNNITTNNNNNNLVSNQISLRYFQDAALDLVTHPDTNCGIEINNESMSRSR